MLDNVTKKNIDNCRDTLVGKVPDPKSQIEQITLALIYKFMDDMDKESMELGGKPKFFTGDFEKYSWRKILDPSLGGKEMLDLYSEALDILQTNASFPELFRNIFKNAYLPYRDPATLKLFLKHINEFEYSHSEKLGDAFEYLLSVMGSQGDAGQFRTPRHVIDFIAKCLDPKKNETIADPACGTSGFLLSAYKHILEQNTDKRAGDKLTPDERKKLSENFTGYDISPDMVRLSLVNMYLHGFTTPKIFEYDTLSSEDRWNETFDVILANPPFMTPKGGIRPHKKFGVQANKAEVLFTDYIAEHLNKNGRAGIVVPNGIVATTQTAYKQLRKLLVEDSLIAVISLPAGCFNPYSGVKTSILMLDKGLAKKSDNVLFIKINNDGFDLGAQRREIDKNDLPTALEAFSAFKHSITEGKNFNTETYNDLCYLVEKEKVLANKDVVFSGERYIEGKVVQTEFELYKLGEICDVRDGTHDSPKYVLDGYPLITSKNIIDGKIDFTNVNLISKEDLDKVNKRSFVEDGDLIMPMIGTIGNPIIVKKDREFGIKNVALIKANENSRINNVYLKYILGSNVINEHFVNEAKGVAQKYLSLGFLRDLEIPLPPVEIQEQIVAEIEGYQKIIDGAKMVVENYKPTITINPEWDVVELGDSEIEIIDGDRGKNYPKKEEFSEKGFCLFLSTKNVRDNGFLFNDLSFITEEKDNLLRKGKLKRNDIVLTTRGTIGNIAIYSPDVKFEHIRINSGMLLLRVNPETLNSMYIYKLFQTEFIQNQFKEITSGAAQPQLPIHSLISTKIPLPPLEEQTQIVERIEQEQALVNANKQLIFLFEQKIKDKINEVWGVTE